MNSIIVLEYCRYGRGTIIAER